MNFRGFAAHDERLQETLRVLLDRSTGNSAFYVDPSGWVAVEPSTSLDEGPFNDRVRELARNCLERDGARGHDPFWSAEPAASGRLPDETLTCLALPLHRGSELVGLIGVVDCLPDHEEEQRRALSRIAGEMAPHLLGRPPNPADSRIAVIGSGFVGLTVASCLAHLGHLVHCTDILTERVAELRAGRVPFLEDGLPSLLQEGLRDRRLSFGTDNVAAVEDAEFVFLCLPTPQGANGEADLSRLVEVAAEIAPHLRSDSVVIKKSTAPVGAAHLLRRTINRDDVHIVTNPEFLREGTAVSDFLDPDRIVIGADDRRGAERVASLYRTIDSPILMTNPESAELAKYASNAFLATKLSFINSMADISERLGADINDVATIMGLDSRMSPAFLAPGPGWGGSCFPKDTVALLRQAQEIGYDFSLLESAISLNERRFVQIADRVESMMGGSVEGKVLTAWGLAFKAGTSDLRESPSLRVLALLKERGALVRAYDPALGSARLEGIELFDDPYRACVDASAIFVGTEWPEFRHIDFQLVRKLVRDQKIFDARGVLDVEQVLRNGFTIERIGLPPALHAPVVAGDFATTGAPSNTSDWSAWSMRVGDEEARETG